MSRARAMIGRSGKAVAQDAGEPPDQHRIVHRQDEGARLAPCQPLEELGPRDVAEQDVIAFGARSCRPCRRRCRSPDNPCRGRRACRRPAGRRGRSRRRSPGPSAAASSPSISRARSCPAMRLPAIRPSLASSGVTVRPMAVTICQKAAVSAAISCAAVAAPSTISVVSDGEAISTPVSSATAVRAPSKRSRAAVTSALTSSTAEHREQQLLPVGERPGGYRRSSRR